MPRIVCISDTHGLHEALTVPDGDVFIHAGDMTLGGREQEVAAFAAWLAALPTRTRSSSRATTIGYSSERPPVHASCSAT